MVAEMLSNEVVAVSYVSAGGIEATPRVPFSAGAAVASFAASIPGNLEGNVKPLEELSITHAARTILS